VRDVVRFATTCRQAQSWVRALVAQQFTRADLVQLFESVPSSESNRAELMDARPETAERYQAGQCAWLVFRYQGFNNVSFVRHLTTNPLPEDRRSVYRTYCAPLFTARGPLEHWIHFHSYQLQWYPLLDQAILACLARFEAAARRAQQVEDDTRLLEMRTVTCH
jgi:hypothetical protein